MITGAYPSQSLKYTLFFNVGRSGGVEITEKLSRRGEGRSGELSCTGMTLAVFQHDGKEKVEKFISRKPKNKDGGHVPSARRCALLSAGV